MDNNSTYSHLDHTPSSEGSGSKRNPKLFYREGGGGRSVNDYESDEQLRRALLAFDAPMDYSGINSIGDTEDGFSRILEDIMEGQPVQKVARIGEKEGDIVVEALDWVLPRFDATDTKPQTLQHEFERLKVLKTYNVLDGDREEAFDRITALASRIFDIPIAIVSLIDLGRQFSMSSHGLERGFGAPRKMAFCAHTIMCKDDMLIIPDTLMDSRFFDHPGVTDYPFIRFYAGCSLLSPEGYKLGTFCIVDSVPRAGLTSEQRDTLCDLANMTVKVMVDRRYQLEEKAHSKPPEKIAYTVNDLMTPLMGLQMSLSLIKDDEKVKSALGLQHLELIQSASSCADLLVRICQNSLQDQNVAVGDVAVTSTVPHNNATDHLNASSKSQTNSQNLTTSIMLSALIENLQKMLKPIVANSKISLVVQSDPSVASLIIDEDLKVFRSAINLLTNAIRRTIQGSVIMSIHAMDNRTLVFECEDTGADIAMDDYQYLFQPCNSDASSLLVSLSLVASLVDSMHGEYGYRPRSTANDGSIRKDSNGNNIQGSVFWFSIPLQHPISCVESSNKQCEGVQHCYGGYNGDPRRNVNEIVVDSP